MSRYDGLTVLKKDGSIEQFDPNKVIRAITLSAQRAMVKVTSEEFDHMLDMILDKIEELELTQISIEKMHQFVECTLDSYNSAVAKSYREYRNYKIDFVDMMNKVYERSQSIRYVGDRENANTDSALVATKRSLIFNELNKRLYRKFFMTVEERQACRDGYIYIHDQSARLDTFNCFARSTEFITCNGVRSFEDFSNGDLVKVPSITGKYRCAVVRSYGRQKLQAVRFEWKGVAGWKFEPVLVTPNHRWILKDGSETTNLKVGDELIETPKITTIPSNCSYVGNRQIVVSSIDPIEKEEEVWCLEVEEDHNFFLAGGIPTGNCCLFDAETVMHGGFEMGNIFYNEPKTLDTAYDVLSDLTLATASQQYGGFTIPEVDKLMAYFAKKSYDMYYAKYVKRDRERFESSGLGGFWIEPKELLHKWAMEDVRREFEQGWQGIEMKLNTVGSSRGDYPFITMTFGLATDEFGRMASETFFKVHMEGQGKPGFKRPVLFPKLVFLYDEELHDEGGVNHDLWELAVKCSSVTMYPDHLSLTGDGYVPEMYKKYKRVVSPMGKCKSAHVKRYLTACSAGVA